MGRRQPGTGDPAYSPMLTDPVNIAVRDAVTSTLDIESEKSTRRLRRQADIDEDRLCRRRSTA
jgi:hypothetical protein